MNHGLIEIDHLLTSVEDPVAAGTSFERMGFTVTPLSRTESMGIMNRLVLMTPVQDGTANFIELMGMSDPARTHPEMRALLAGPEGTRSMVLATLDAQASVDELRIDGYEVARPVSLERKWRLPDGKVLDVAFDVIMPIEAPLLFNACRYRTREHYVRPDWLAHRNGALRMTAVLCCAEDVRAAAAYYSKLFGCAPRPIPSGGLEIMPANVSLRLHEARSVRDRFPGAAPRAPTGYFGYRIQVRDLGRLRECLHAGNVRHWSGSGSVVVPTDAAHGNLIEFEEGRQA